MRQNDEFEQFKLVDNPAIAGAKEAIDLKVRLKRQNEAICMAEEQCEVMY